MLFIQLPVLFALSVQRTLENKLHNQMLQQNWMALTFVHYLIITNQSIEQTINITSSAQGLLALQTIKYIVNSLRLFI